MLVAFLLELNAADVTEFYYNVCDWNEFKLSKIMT